MSAVGRWLLVLGLLLTLAGCATAPPRDMNDSCEIFREKDDWYDATKDAYDHWGVPPHVQLAIIHQESRFRHDAKPPRGKLLWVIPWFRQSSAYGYAQVKDATWEWYQDDTGNGWADRDDFEDATDFIGWYCYKTYEMTGVSKWDAYNQYLAYHEGQGGYQRGTYKSKPWLMKVARKVDNRAKRYHTQLSRCEDELESWGLWPF